MTKLELNNRLAELYDEYQDEHYYTGKYDGFSMEFNAVLLIDDWNRLMPLALAHGISLSLLGDLYADGDINRVLARANTPNNVTYSSIAESQKYTDHESPEDAARYAIAMALVKLAESKP